MDFVSYAKRIKSLDETPERMGHKKEEARGQICLGGQQPLDKTTIYVDYETGQN